MMSLNNVCVAFMKTKLMDRNRVSTLTLCNTKISMSKIKSLTNQAPPPPSAEAGNILCRASVFASCNINRSKIVGEHESC